MQTNPGNNDVLLILVPITLSVVGIVTLMGGPADALHAANAIWRDVSYEVIRLVRSLI